MSIKIALLYIFLFTTLSTTAFNDTTCVYSLNDVMDKLIKIENMLEEQSRKDHQRNILKSITSLIPETDSVCKYKWSTGECHPPSICAFQPKFGDFTVSRMCRLKTDHANHEDHSEPSYSHQHNDENDDDDDINSDEEEEHLNVLQRMHRFVKRTVSHVADRVVDNAPFSDEVCSWSMRALRCVPESYCAFDYQVGDYSLHRACRLTLTGEDEEEDGEEVPGEYALLSSGQSQESDDDQISNSRDSLNYAGLSESVQIRTKIVEEKDDSLKSAI